MTMCTLNHDGSIHAVAMWYGFVEGAVAIEGPTHALTRDEVTEAYFGLNKSSRDKAPPRNGRSLRRASVPPVLVRSTDRGSNPCPGVGNDPR